MCDCVRVCVLSESVRPSVARSEGGRLENRKREGAGQLGMSEPLSCEEMGGFCAVRTARSLSEQVWELHKPGSLGWLALILIKNRRKKRSRCLV